MANPQRNIQRRLFLLGAATAGISFALQGCSESERPDAAANDRPAPTVVQYGFLVDPWACRGCDACVSACREGNRLAANVRDRRKVTSIPVGTRSMSVSTTCMHCAHPSCMEVCPANAISKNERGIVTVDKGRCIGCKYCGQACPYDAPSYSEYGMDKCDCCLGANLSDGKDPYCVEACAFDALRFGPLGELSSMEDGAAFPIAKENEPSCLIVREKL